jgi:muramoyltetrapeptide carboxypeptidase
VINPFFRTKVGAVASSRPNFNSPFLRLEQRASELLGMLYDTEVDAIWCMDGGAGASYLLPILAEAYDKKPWAKKAVLGFSDITFLLMYFTKLGHPCFLAPNVACESDHDEEELRRAVTTLVDQPSTLNLACPAEILQPGRAEGTFIGGTLSVLANMIGTDYCPSFDGSVLFLEEHGANAPGEREYLLWERLQGVELSNRWKGVSAFVVGEIETGGPYSTEEDLFPDVWDVLDHTLVPMTAGPVATGIPFGMSRKDSVLPLGCPVVVQATHAGCAIRWSSIRY